MKESGFPQFGPFALDVDQRELMRDGKSVRLAPRDIDLLIFLVERAGRIVDKERLLTELWAGRVVEEGNIARHIATLRQALGDTAESPTYIETVPKRGYRFIATVTARVGAKEEPAADGTAPAAVPSPHAPRARNAARFFAAAGAALALAAGFYWAVHRFHEQDADPTAIRSLAVLPLMNLSGDPAKEYFADALTEALLTDLAQIHAVRVISRASVMRYKGTTEPIPAIARQLKVEAIVEGGVMVAGDRVRITAQLVDGRSDRHLWAQSFEGELRDVIGLQRRVSRSIAERIRVTIQPEEAARLAQRGSIDAEIYDAYARARFFWNKRTGDDIANSIVAFRGVTERDPTYAPAFAGLADAYAVAAEYRVIPPVESWPLAEAAARRALVLDPDSSDAHASLANVLAARWQWDDAEREFRTALDLNPGYSRAHQYYGEYLTLRNRHAEALEQQRLAHDLDPVSLIVNAVFGITYYYAGDYGKAERQLNETLELDPQFAVAHEMLGRTCDKLREHARAIEHFTRAVELSERSPEYLAALARSMALHGDAAPARALLEELEQMAAQRYVSHFEFAMVHAALGDRERAFGYLDAAFEERATWLPFLAVGDGLPELRDDARYARLIERMGL